MELSAKAGRGVAWARAAKFTRCRISFVEVRDEVTWEELCRSKVG